MKERFVDWNPRGETLIRVDQCTKIIREYQAQGLMLTLRQLYYQFVSRDLIPNTPRSYKNLGGIVAKARTAGLLDWNAIEDRGRSPDVPSEFRSIKHLVDVALRAFRLPRWKGQPNYAELWVEKAALAGVLEPMASRYHAVLMVNKGYSSLSAMYESAKRLDAASERGVDDIYIFYLGDHDPSGEDMVRDIEQRLNLFTYEALPIHVQKLALTMEQVQQYNPPPNTAKLSDSRAEKYIAEHGQSSWEVDALDPATLQQIIADAFEEVIDMDMMDGVKEQEEKDKEQLREFARSMARDEDDDEPEDTDEDEPAEDSEDDPEEEAPEDDDEE